MCVHYVSARLVAHNAAYKHAREQGNQSSKSALRQIAMWRCAVTAEETRQECSSARGMQPPQTRPPHRDHTAHSTIYVGYQQYARAHISANICLFYTSAWLNNIGIIRLINMFVSVHPDQTQPNPTIRIPQTPRIYRIVELATGLRPYYVQQLPAVAGGAAQQHHQQFAVQLSGSGLVWHVLCVVGFTLGQWFLHRPYVEITEQFAMQDMQRVQTGITSIIMGAETLLYLLVVWLHLGRVQRYATCLGRIERHFDVLQSPVYGVRGVRRVWCARSAAAGSLATRWLACLGKLLLIYFPMYALLEFAWQGITAVQWWLAMLLLITIPLVARELIVFAFVRLVMQVGTYADDLNAVLRHVRDAEEAAAKMTTAAKRRSRYRNREMVSI